MVLVRYLGVDIHVEIDGKFWAKVNGKFVENRAVSKVKTAIREAAPTVTLLASRDPKWKPGELDPVSIGAIEDRLGTLYAVTPTPGYNGLKDYRASEVYEPDEAVLDRIKDENRGHFKEADALNAAHRERLTALVGELKPITPERFAELMAKVTAERA